MSVCKIIFHEKINSIQCVCGFIDTSHQCNKEIKGKIIFVPCPDCRVCEKEADDNEYNSLRLKRNDDGYLICRTCHDKLGCEPICEKCFC